MSGGSPQPGDRAMPRCCDRGYRDAALHPERLCPEDSSVSPRNETASVPRRGFFLTLEGVEGAGKSTLARLLEKKLKTEECEVVVTAEPGGDGLADRIRRLLLTSVTQIADRAELLLFEAARAQHVETKIRPALERGAIVICDRYTDSSIAYQGFARGIDLDTVRWLNNYATGGLSPDLTLLLDLPAKTGLGRQRRVDRVSSESLQFHESVRMGFLAAAESEPHRFMVIDASQDLDEVLRQALAAIEAKRSTI